MTPVGDLLARLHALDVRLALDGEKLSVNAPSGALSADLRAELATFKEALKEHLRAHPPQPPRTAAAPALQPVPRQATMPVSHSQQRLWFLRQMDPLSSAYNIGAAFHMHGRLDVAAFERSVGDLVARHESLRTRFEAVDGVPRCSVVDDARLPVEFVDLSQAEAAGREQAAIDLAAELAQRQFDLAHCPLLRLLLVRLSPQHHLCCIVVDHIVADGISIGILFMELQALYRQYTGGPAAALPPQPVQYLDYVHWQEAMLAAGALDAHMDYWKQQLRGLPPVLPLPTDRPRPPLQTSHGARSLEVLPAPLVAELKAFAGREGLTLYMVLLAGFEILLYRYSGEDDFAVGSAVGARNRLEVERVVGFFANNIVMRANLAGDPTVRELLTRVREVALKAYANQDMPFDVLVEALAPRRDLDHSPLFQVLFGVHSQILSRRDLGGLTFELQELPLDTARFDLSVDVFDRDDGLRVSFEYNSDLFDEATIRQMMGNYRRLVAGLVADPQARIGALPMLDADEEQALLAHGRGRALPPPEHVTVPAMVDAQARRTPGTAAVVFDGRTLTYAELDARANRLAHHLLALGVRTESLVGVWMERSIDMVVALLAVLKAGAAYVPLDPAFPRDRLEFMIGDAALDVVVTHSALAADPGAEGPRAVRLDADAAAIAARPATPPPVEVAASHLAYTIYTSGSTGRPKGVEIEHAAVVNFLRSMHAEPGIVGGDRLVAVTTLSFDIAGLEIWGPLTAGGTVVLASRATTLDGQQLAALLDEAEATLLQATPATWRLLLDSGWQGRPGLKMLCGGEALPGELADRLLALPGGELWNMYGPTETTIWSTLSRVHEPTSRIGIGRPIAETTVHVLEPSGLPAPIGVAGELCIGGAGVARGYRNRPELTGERFVQLTVGDAAPERVYRTGDLVRMRRNGQLEFIGRRDDQVKVRGFRIELGEIETVLLAHPAVRHAVVAARHASPADVRLVAYIVFQPNQTLTTSDVRRYLRTLLPDYMTPSLVMVVDAIATTPNGKIDRAALPDPFKSIAPPSQAFVAPTPGAEQAMADIWCQVLQVQRVGAEDNFFELGGHSLLTLRVTAAVERQLGFQMDPRTLFFQNLRQATAALVAANAGQPG